jgi:hypothetical protein
VPKPIRCHENGHADATDLVAVLIVLDRIANFAGPKDALEVLCRADRYWLLLNLRASRWVTLGSSHCKCLFNQELLAGSMTTAQRPSPKTKYRSEFSILTGEVRESLHGD